MRCEKTHQYSSRRRRTSCSLEDSPCFMIWKSLISICLCDSSDYAADWSMRRERERERLLEPSGNFDSFALPPTCTHACLLSNLESNLHAYSNKNHRKFVVRVRETWSIISCDMVRPARQPTSREIRCGLKRRRRRWGWCRVLFSCDEWNRLRRNLQLDCHVNRWDDEIRSEEDRLICWSELNLSLRMSGSVNTNEWCSVTCSDEEMRRSFASRRKRWGKNCWQMSEGPAQADDQERQ